MSIEAICKAFDITSVPAVEQRMGKWFVIDLVGDSALRILPVRIVHKIRSEFQDIAIVVSEDFGHMLLLDGEIQCSESDEFLYHETLVHFPLASVVLARGSVERVVILGGGDGCAAREVLRWKTVRECTVVEIDEAVPNVFRSEMKDVWRPDSGALDDARCHVHIQDGRRFLQGLRTKVDAVFFDLTDAKRPATTQSGTSHLLYGIDAINDAIEVVRDGGSVVLQGRGSSLESGSKGDLRGAIELVARRLSSVNVFVGSLFVPSFGEEWVVYVLSKSGNQPGLSPSAIQQVLKENLDPNKKLRTRLHRLVCSDLDHGLPLEKWSVL